MTSRSRNCVPPGEPSLTHSTGTMNGPVLVKRRKARSPTAHNTGLVADVCKTEVVPAAVPSETHNSSDDERLLLAQKNRRSLAMAKDTLAATLVANGCVPRAVPSLLHNVTTVFHGPPTINARSRTAPAKWGAGCPPSCGKLVTTAGAALPSQLHSSCAWATGRNQNSRLPATTPPRQCAGSTGCT